MKIRKKIDRLRNELFDIHHVAEETGEQNENVDDDFSF